MITEDVARNMMKKLFDLKKKANKTSKDIDKQVYFNYEAECIEKLKYFVETKAGKYKQFSNHLDLTQDAYEALLKGIRSFKLKDASGKDKGSFFFWIGLFVNTKLSRSANNHSVIRYPMKVAKFQRPHKETVIPVIPTDPQHSPEKICEQIEMNSEIKRAMAALSKRQREFVSMAYGFNGDKPMSITKICEKKNVSRANCLKIINKALEILKTEIEL